jgi:hypothetical protein
MKKLVHPMLVSLLIVLFLFLAGCRSAKDVTDGRDEVEQVISTSSVGKWMGVSVEESPGVLTHVTRGNMTFGVKKNGILPVYSQAAANDCSNVEVIALRMSKSSKGCQMVFDPASLDLQPGQLRQVEVIIAGQQTRFLVLILFEK